MFLFTKVYYDCTNSSDVLRLFTNGTIFTNHTNEGVFYARLDYKTY